MSNIDLHVHSSASDGSYTPQEVTQLAKDAGLSHFALTDHDTVDGIEQALTYAQSIGDITVIPGVELSCYYGKREIHILGLFVDHTNSHFLQELQKLKDAREGRNIKMVEKFVEAGLPLTLEDLKHGNPNSVITRAHFARVLTEKGYCKSKNEAFEKYVGIGCPFYLPKPKVTPEHVIPLITGAGGIAILAHPYSYKMNHSEVITLIDSFIPLGLSGIECYYSTYDDGQTQQLRQIAFSKNLLVSGGSDFHGVVKPDIQIGTGRGHLKIPDKLLWKMQEHRIG